MKPLTITLLFLFTLFAFAQQPAFATDTPEAASAGTTQAGDELTPPAEGTRDLSEVNPPAPPLPEGDNPVELTVVPATDAGATGSSPVLAVTVIILVVTVGGLLASRYFSRR